MKKTITLLVALLCLAACADAPKLMTIKGTIKNYDGSELMFLDALSESANFKADEKGRFSYTFDSKEKHQAMLIYGKTMFTFLANNGTTSSLDIDVAGDPQVKFGGDNVEENQYLNGIDDLYSLASFTDDEVEDAWIPSSFSEYEAAIDKVSDGLKVILEKCSDKEFAQKNAEELNSQVIKEKNSYMDLINPVNSDSDYNAYMEKIDRNSMSEAKNGQIRHYFTWLSKIQNVSESNFAMSYLDFIGKQITDQKVKNYLSTEEMKDVFMIPGYMNENLYNRYMEICDDAESRKDIESKYNQMVSLSKGNPAPDFEMKDVDGNVVKLSDLRGKVVYVDFWASWCVFCCDEIPFLKEVYKKYGNNKKLEIISVSLDNDLDAWKTAMEEYDQPWKQYVSNGEMSKAIYDGYMISGIPHFLMIDADGNLISSAAPRPSDEALLDMIESNI